MAGVAKVKYKLTLHAVICVNDVATNGTWHSAIHVGSPFFKKKKRALDFESPLDFNRRKRGKRQTELQTYSSLAYPQGSNAQPSSFKSQYHFRFADFFTRQFGG